MKNLTVRAAKISDRAAIRKNLVVCWSETYADRLGPKNIRMLLNSLESDDIGGVLPQSDEIAMVSELNNQIVGLAVGAVRQQSAYVWGCYVQKQYHRQGMGRAMLQSLLGALSDYKGVIVYVLDSSSEAQQFYKELGFTVRDTTEYELVQGITFPGHMYSVLASNLKIE